MIEQHYSWNYPEVEEGDVVLCVGLGFFFGLRLALSDVVELINHLFVLRFFFQVSQFGWFFRYFMNDLLMDDELDLALVRVIRNCKQKQPSSFLFLILRPQPEHMIVLSFLDAEGHIIYNPRRQQQLLFVIERKLINRTCIRVPNVYR